MSVRHPEPECSKFCSSSSKQVTICQACQAYQLMHNTQGAARPRRTPTSRRSADSICTSQLACGVSAPDSSKATSPLPYTDKQHVARKPRESRQRFAVRATGRAGCRITRPQLRSRVSTLVAGRVGDAHVVPHTTHHAACKPLTHTRTPGPDVTVSGCFGPHMRLVL